MNQEHLEYTPFIWRLRSRCRTDLVELEVETSGGILQGSGGGGGGALNMDHMSLQGEEKVSPSARSEDFFGAQRPISCSKLIKIFHGAGM